MSLGRLPTALLLLALTAIPAPRPIHALQTSSSTEPAKPKRAPAAKPSKTAKTTKTKKSSKSPKPHATPAKTTTTPVSLHAIPLSSREAITARITESLASPRVAIENPEALQPFFNHLRDLEANPQSQLLRIIQFGDSHTAADLFTSDLRNLFQSKFGDGGAGFQYPGYPFTGYRIHGTHRAQSTGWTALGTHLRDIGDGMVGMGGVSLLTTGAGNWVSLDADATSLEVQYLLQPNGGSIDIYDGDTLLTTIPTASTDATTANTAGHYDTTVAPGPHHFEVRTTQQAPVRLLGLSTENASGITYEAAGINGAEASLFLRWNETLQQTLMAQANPALIVLAYGTNEAGDHNWTEDSYATLFRHIIERCRRLAPNASILVIGPPDRALRTGHHGWAAFPGVDRIVEAQRTVCRQLNCAYWDQRARMGGFGSMRDWVSIAWAQPDHTHFTGEGYNELAAALFSDIIQQYTPDHTPLLKAAGDAQ